MKRSRILALVTAATTALALAACAAPEDDDSGTTTDSGVNASEATSATGSAVAGFSTVKVVMGPSWSVGSVVSRRSLRSLLNHRDRS